MPQIREFTSDEEDENALEGEYIVLDGVRFDMLGRLSVIDMSELADAAINPDLMDAAEAASIHRTLALAFGDNWPVLKAHIREHKTPDKTVLSILQCVNEAVQEGIERITARPTQPSSSSPGGSEGTDGQPARSISLSKGTGKSQPRAKSRTPRKGEQSRRTG